MAENIFNQYFINDYIKACQKNLTEEIDKFEVTDTTDVTQLVDEFKLKYTIEPLILKDYIPSVPKETTRNKLDYRGATYKQKIFEIDVTIPFDGDYMLFYCKPSTSTIVFLDESIRIRESPIKATIILEDLDPIKFKANIEKIIYDLSLNIPRINAEIAPWNSGLDNFIKQLLENRKSVITKKFDFMEKIGLKVNPKSDEFMMPSPISKKSIPKPVSDTTKDIKKELIPFCKKKYIRI
jgi:hypothetical protein